MFKSQKIVRLVMALAMALALAGSIPFGSPQVAKAALGSVTGTVTDGSTGDPLYPATITMVVAKDGTLETTLAGGTEQDTTSTSSDGTIENDSVSDGGQSGILTTQSGSIHWWVWLVIGLVAIGVVGFLLKKFVFYHD